MTLDRLDRHLRLRLRRRSTRAAFRAAEAADLLVGHRRVVDGLAVVVYADGPRLLRLTGKDNLDQARLLRILSRRLAPPAAIAIGRR
jgi:hypothetical protein